MAEIFLARQWGEGGFFRDVVIKRLFRHLAEHDKALSMFQYEARLLAELTHPNIPQVYELGFEDGTWFLAMELVDGHTVADLWRAGAKIGQVMPLPVAAGVLLQACEALHHAHERLDRGGNALRIVHRDVTPHNMMVTRDGIVKVMDFGVAQTAARRDTEHGAVKGTFSYMAPEQVRARTLDKRADVFALGVILYELTTGTRLFRGNDVQVMTSIVEQDAPPPSSRIPDYPRDLEEIVLAALSRDRKTRVPSAAHLALALEEFALRNGVVIGHNTIARYAHAVFPYEREQEQALALVQDQVDEADEPEFDAVHDARGERERVSGPGGIDGGVGHWEDHLDMDESGIMADLDMLAPEGPRSTRPARPEQTGAHLRPVSLPPEELEDILFEDITEDELGSASGRPEPLEGFDEDRGDRPVVLLDSPKRPRDTDFVDDLARRLEDDDDES